MNTPFLSIIMPALNEEKNISSSVGNTLKAFDDFKIDGEIVVINDGSSDRTPELVKEAMVNEGARVRMINHTTPQGIGASFWHGIDEAKGEIVCMLPGDNENDPREILRYLKLLNDVDMVVPFVCNREARPRLRNFLSRLYTSIVNISFGTTFNYTNGTVLYRKAILKDVYYKCSSFFFQTDILIRLAKKGYLFAEVPYRLGLRKSGRSKAVTFRSLKQIIKGYLNLLKDVYLKGSL